MMTLAQHNSIMGWLNSLSYNKNNILSGQSQFTKAPYQTMIADPTLVQCWKNWNLADTGMVLATVALFCLIAYPLAARSSHSFIDKKVAFYRMIGISWMFGGVFGIRNSCYRLQGLVPNGLKKSENFERIKYNYTENFFQQISSLFESSQQQGKDKGKDIKESQDITKSDETKKDDNDRQ